jgi:hypothetical protein
MRKGVKNKLPLLFSRYGLPTSNRNIAKPYVAELRPRAIRVGKELYEVFGVKRGDREGRDKQWGRICLFTKYYLQGVKPDTGLISAV